MSKHGLPESQAAKAKAKCRVTNWPDDDRARVRRGDVMVWFEEDFLRHHWHGKATGHRGKPLKYSDIAIQTLLMLKAVFGLPYHSVEGLAGSLMRLMGVALPVPDPTQMSRRAKRLAVIPRRERPGPVYWVVDSTGLKIHGEGEWKVRQQGAGKRRTWRKVHLAVDGHAKDVIGMEVTAVEWADGEVFEGLVEQVEGPIEQIAGDGAYDTRRAYEVAVSREARLVVPPRDNAVPWEDGHPRNDALRQIAEQGMAAWKKTTGYHCRSLAENAMYRLKQLFDGSLASRLFETQVTDVHVRIAAMNLMTYLGMPISVRVGGTSS
ncbi:IS5 family transposase [Methylococcus geothermalis]|uniref:IS5 family transposase n=1 Tax=Methylococcus geothermalis TaxID=2681310 RepID=A0A858QBP6_9GAMM|nr:IS5 family transposase [Methylococcus geothermalis]QJD31347.1 IS5 family transposase [Methylococcus geothermalis]